MVCGEEMLLIEASNQKNNPLASVSATSARLTTELLAAESLDHLTSLKALNKEIRTKKREPDHF